MRDAAARFAVHQRDFSVLVFVIRDDVGEVTDCQFLASLIPDDGPQGVEQLPSIESVTLFATDSGDDIVEIFEDNILHRYAMGLGIGSPRLSYRLCNGFLNLCHKWNGVWRLAICRDRHMGRRDVEPDRKVLVLWRFGDGVRKSTSEDVNLTLVTGRKDIAGDWCAMGAHIQSHFGSRANQSLDHDGNFRAWLGRKADGTRCDGVGTIRKPFDAYRSKTMRRYWSSACASCQQKFGRLIAVDVVAKHAGHSGSCNDLASMATRAAVKV